MVEGQAPRGGVRPGELDIWGGRCPGVEFQAQCLTTVQPWASHFPSLIPQRQVSTRGGWGASWSTANMKDEGEVTWGQGGSTMGTHMLKGPKEGDSSRRQRLENLAREVVGEDREGLGRRDLVGQQPLPSPLPSSMEHPAPTLPPCTSPSRAPITSPSPSPSPGSQHLGSHSPSTWGPPHLRDGISLS